MTNAFYKTHTFLPTTQSTFPEHFLYLIVLNGESTAHETETHGKKERDVRGKKGRRDIQDIQNTLKHKENDKIEIVNTVTCKTSKRLRVYNVSYTWEPNYRAC